MKLHALLPLAALAANTLFGTIALDTAANYATWTDSSNEGSGFAAWSLNNNDNGSTLFAGNFLGDSTAGAGDINTSGQSFGLFANPSSAFSTATRSFSAALSTNDQFTFQMALNFDNGNKGFNLRTAGDSIFNFEVSAGGSVASANATLNAGSGAGYNYGGSDAVLDVTLEMTSASSLSYSISRTSSQGLQGVLFSGTVTSITNPVDNFEFYISGTDDGAAQNNLYFNNLSVSAIPEPSTYAALCGLIGLGLVIYRRKK